MFIYFYKFNFSMLQVYKNSFILYKYIIYIHCIIYNIKRACSRARKRACSRTYNRACSRARKRACSRTYNRACSRASTSRALISSSSVHLLFEPWNHVQARLVYRTSRTRTSFYRAEHRAAHERLSSFTPLAILHAKLVDQRMCWFK